MHENFGTNYIYKGKLVLYVEFQNHNTPGTERKIQIGADFIQQNLSLEHINNYIISKAMALHHGLVY